MSAAQEHNLKLPDSDLQATWQEAFTRMCEVAPFEEQSIVAEVSVKFDNPDQLAQFREYFREHLTPESVFFLELSEAAKRKNASDDQEHGAEGDSDAKKPRAEATS